MKTILMTLLALLAFAGNSVLCRLALGYQMIDPMGFTALRLLAGALTLILLLTLSQKLLNSEPLNKNTQKPFLGALALFVYASCFSYAYVQLDTGTGALILFGFVQLTLLTTSWLIERRPQFQEIMGMMLAFSGLVYWVIPAWGTPSILGFVLMAVAGVAWGFYTLLGRKSKQPLVSTTQNFIYAIPLVLLLSLWEFQPHLWTLKGVLLGLLSGALTSGVGYAVWYAVLPQLNSMKAAVVQLLVPIIAAAGGWLFVGEIIGHQLLVSTALILGGLSMVMVKNNASASTQH